jgi:hypothetical protein
VTITFTFRNVTKSLKITVTPIPSGYDATPAKPTSVDYKNGVNIEEGLIAEGPSPRRTRGITFRADVVSAGIKSGYAGFVQNVTSLQNGVNGRAENPDASGWMYTTGNGPDKNMRPVEGSKLDYDDRSKTITTPVLDLFRGTGPIYDVGFRDQPPGAEQRITANDSPWTGNPDRTKTAKTVAIDYKVDFKTYLVWRYKDETLYTLAYLTWSVNFYAKRNDPNGPVVLQRPPSEVKANDSVLSNDDPSRTSGMIANLAIRWQ